MRVTVIGGTGHIGTYLIPRLVRAGHNVNCISRGTRTPYLPDSTWREVELIEADREIEDRDGIFGARIKKLRPDVVIDLVCYSESSAQKLVASLIGEIQLLLHCGTIWVHGHSVSVPTKEDQARHPFGEYGIQKAAIETYLLTQSRLKGLPIVVLHPGHIVGKGWWPLNPAGHFNPEIFQKLSRGEEITIPNLGMETVHHVHADDVAQAFIQAISFQTVAIGEAFHVVSNQALTLRGYAEVIANWFGQPSKIKFVPWEGFKQICSPEDSAATWDHIAHSPNCSNTKIKKYLDYSPRYSSVQAIIESLEHLREKSEF